MTVKTLTDQTLMPYDSPLFNLMENVVKERVPSRRIDLFVRWMPLIRQKVLDGCGNFLWIVGNYDDRIVPMDYPLLEQAIPDQQRLCRKEIDSALEKVSSPVFEYWYKFFYLIKVTDITLSSLEETVYSLNGTLTEIDRASAQDACQSALGRMPCPPPSDRSGSIVVADEVYFNQVLQIVDREGLLLEFQKALNLVRSLSDKQYYRCHLSTGLTPCSFFCKTQYKERQDSEWIDLNVFSLSFMPGARSWKID